MHYHAELIMPPCDNKDLGNRINEILEPFSEHNEDSEYFCYAFWDYWIIGGRYSGSKIQTAIGDDAMESFSDWLTEQKVCDDWLCVTLDLHK